MKMLILAVLAVGLLITGCVASEGDQQVGYKQVNAIEAMEIMNTEENYIILDVRTVAEYQTRHIYGAICIPNERIGTEMPEELPDKEQLILIYCRSGNRSKQAAKSLLQWATQIS